MKSLNSTPKIGTSTVPSHRARTFQRKLGLARAYPSTACGAHLGLTLLGMWKLHDRRTLLVLNSIGNGEDVHP